MKVFIYSGKVKDLRSYLKEWRHQTDPVKYQPPAAFSCLG